MKILAAILLSVAITLGSTAGFANSNKSGTVPEQEHLENIEQIGSFFVAKP